MNFDSLNTLLARPQLTCLMEAHNALSARIVEEAGFEAIWASGLTMSAAMGVRDNNEASWSQVLAVLEQMADVTRVPILCDADTGYGNFNNARRFLAKLEQRGIAGMCIEDKLFPKTNSFIGEAQPLADIDEFCGKIAACVDTRKGDFTLIARLEGYIAGRGTAEMLERASRYQEAGADALLVHSKRTDAAQILEFMAQWDGGCPIVVVPTTYPDVPQETLAQAGVSAVIWANFTLRAAMRAMTDLCRRVRAQGGVQGLDGQIDPVSRIFDLTGQDELADAEDAYLPNRRPRLPGEAAE